MRKFFAMEKRGEIKKGTAKRWAKHTPSIKLLPEKKKEREINKRLKKALKKRLKKALKK